MKPFRQFTTESIIDIPRKHYSKTIFDKFNTDEPVLKSSVIKFIEYGMREFESVAPIKTHYLIGSMLTKQYRKDADLDINLWFDVPAKDRSVATVKLRRMVAKMNGREIPGTEHPVNYYVITDKATFNQANEMADNVYDITSNKFIKRSPEKGFDVTDYMSDFKKRVEKIDILKGELHRDLVDFEELKELDQDDIDNLQGEVKKKLAELEKDMKVLINIGHDVWNERQGEFKKDVSPERIRKYGARNRLPKNVIYKMLEKYYYVKLTHDLEDILGDDKKLSDAEAMKMMKNKGHESSKPITDSYEFKDSPVHGLGVFATRDIKEGEQISLYYLNLFEDIPSYQRTDFCRFSNHSHINENVALVENDDNFYAHAINNISEGEELFIDYFCVLENIMSKIGNGGQIIDEVLRWTKGYEHIEIEEDNSSWSTLLNLFIEQGDCPKLIRWSSRISKT